MSILEKINSANDVKRLTLDEKNLLCAEIREFLIENISHTGGHLASNLGVVELTVALHSVFDTSADRLVFDVGHQCYVHKLLTGRRENFSSLRSFGGMSGFPKPCESVEDAFIGGHASDSVSVALGMARARTLTGADYNVVAVLGDGALTGGLAYEGLGDAGESGEPLIVILNDNGMSITENVGGVARYLSHQRLKPQYFSVKRAYHRFVNWLPGGRHLYNFTHRLKARIKRLILGCTMFEEMGFNYLGPVDGHDIWRLTYLLERAKELNCPVILHIVTQKGKGYRFSEENPDEFHGVSGYDIETGEVQKPGVLCYSQVFGDELTAIAEKDDRICAITAAMTNGTGLDVFSKQFPGRFFDVGIAEGHAVSMAAGMAKQGLLPVFAVYSSFLQRGFDMLIHDVAILNLHVVFAVDRAGIVGEDGETHQGVFDVGMLRAVPGMTVLCPSNTAELKSMLRMAVYDCTGPVAVRYPRGGENGFREDLSSESTSVISVGGDITIAAYGNMINQAIEAAELLLADGIHAEVIKLSCISPIDPGPVVDSVMKTRRLLIAEDCVENGCVGHALAAALAQQGVAADRVILLNLDAKFVQHGSVEKLMHECGLDAEELYSAAKEAVLDGRSKA